MDTYTLFVTVLSKGALEHLVLELFKREIGVHSLSGQETWTLGVLQVTTDMSLEELDETLTSIMGSSGYAYLNFVIMSEDEFFWNDQPLSESLESVTDVKETAAPSILDNIEAVNDIGDRS